MKKLGAIMLILALLASTACAAGGELTFDDLGGLQWSFSSGAGGWSTDMQIEGDGAFSGTFHDSEMGDTGEDYPEGSLYVCAFSGRMTLLGSADDYAWKVRVDELTVEDEPGVETIEDGIRYITADPYGISAGDEMLLYRPGTPVDVLPEDMRMWAHLYDYETMPAELENWFLTSEKNESGFVGYAFDGAELANPWEEMTAEELTQASGLSFGVPEGAENVVYSYLREENLAQMAFTMGRVELCARVQPAVPGEDGAWPDISGLYYDWDFVDEDTVGSCDASVSIVQTGEESWVELCQWYDAAPGLMYSLSARFDHDPDGFDLGAVANMVYVPVQGDN
ncbi:MAG: hypothetical protein IJJ23_01520 [Clostridia bacterium]|nr:hypothetical protein [Clostridia bacterium]